MAYYDGETLASRLTRGALPVAEALDIAIQIASGLARAHESGIVHRDVKPANIFLTTRGEAKLLDFGIAKLAGDVGLTRTGTTVGTVAYMAPEQARGEEVDQRADVWSLGVVLYEMLAGERPFRGANEFGVLTSILEEQPRPVRALRPETPAELEAVARQALEKSRDRRYASASQRRALDYLATRKKDIDSTALGYFGVSWGGRLGPMFLALDPRLRTGILLMGGLSSTKSQPEVDPFNFAPRVRVPVLMLNGNQDFIFAVETSQRPLFAALGTPAPQKRHVLFPGGHDIVGTKGSQIAQEVIAWLDQYLGPVR
jgi:serine/threonine protein kinase